MFNETPNFRRRITGRLILSESSGAEFPRGSTPIRRYQLPDVLVFAVESIQLGVKAGPRQPFGLITLETASKIKGLRQEDTNRFATSRTTLYQAQSKMTLYLPDGSIRNDGKRSRIFTFGGWSCWTAWRGFDSEACAKSSPRPGPRHRKSGATAVLLGPVLTNERRMNVVAPMISALQKEELGFYCDTVHRLFKAQNKANRRLLILHSGFSTVSFIAPDLVA